MILPDNPTLEDIQEWALAYEDAYHDCVWPDSDTTNAKRLLGEFREQAQFIADCINKAIKEKETFLAGYQFGWEDSCASEVSNSDVLKEASYKIWSEDRE